MNRGWQYIKHWEFHIIHCTLYHKWLKKKNRVNSGNSRGRNFPFFKTKHNYIHVYLISFLLHWITIFKRKPQNNNHNSTCMFLTTHFTLQVCPFRPLKFHLFIDKSNTVYFSVSNLIKILALKSLIVVIEHTVAGYEWLSQKKTTSCSYIFLTERDECSHTCSWFPLWLRTF